MRRRDKTVRKPYTVVVKNLDGWWSAVCPELGVSGFGHSRDEAISAVARSMQSTLAAHAEALKIGIPATSHLADLRLAPC